MGIFGFFSKEKKESLDQGLQKTSESIFSKLSKAVVGKSKVDEEVLDELEEVLIGSDLGVETTLKVIKRIEERVARDKYLNASELDLILREETGEREHPAQGKRGNDPGGERDWHYLAQAAHVFFHVERVMRCAVANRAGAKEQTRLEKCVRKDVEDGWQPCTSAKAKHHVAQLTDG